MNNATHNSDHRERTAMPIDKPALTRDCLSQYNTLDGRGLLSLPGWSVGDYSYGVPLLRWWGEPVALRIGKFCSFADNVTLQLGGNHRTDWITTYPFSHLEGWPKAHGIVGHPDSRGDIQIGNDVWIASKAMIFSGVTIGDGAVIAAHALVVKDVEPYTVVGGNPAKVIRKRFSDEQIAMLLEMKWWDWSKEEIHDAVALLCSEHIDKLYAYWQQNIKK